MLGALVQWLARAIDLRFDAIRVQDRPRAGTHQDHLRVDVGPEQTDGLNTHLMELAAPFLQALAGGTSARCNKGAVNLGGEALLDDGTDAASRAFRAQGQLLTVQAVLKGIHLLLDDIGHFADGALEQRRRFDDGCGSAGSRTPWSQVRTVSSNSSRSASSGMSFIPRTDWRCYSTRVSSL